MSALRKMPVVEYDPVVITTQAAAPVKQAQIVALPVSKTVKQESRIKNIALFAVAPFIGLAYAMLFPFIGIGALVWFGCRELARMKVVKFVAAPFIGLAMVVLMPFIGIAAMVWVGSGGQMPRALAVRSTRSQ